MISIRNNTQPDCNDFVTRCDADDHSQVQEIHITHSMISINNTKILKLQAVDIVVAYGSEEVLSPKGDFALWRYGNLVIVRGILMSAGWKGRGELLSVGVG